MNKPRSYVKKSERGEPIHFRRENKLVSQTRVRVILVDHSEHLSLKKTG